VKLTEQYIAINAGASLRPMFNYSKTQNCNAKGSFSF